MIELDKSYLHFNFEQIKKKYSKKINIVNKQINDFFSNDEEYMSGWLNWPKNNFTKNEYQQIQIIYNHFKKNKIDKVLVIGIGGSYIGVKAGIQMLSKPKQRSKFIFLTNCNDRYITEIKKILDKSNWAIIVISKSGNTIETAINFRIFREFLLKKYDKKHHERIVVITDPNQSKLLTIAQKNNYFKLSIPPNIGGRFSTLTCVGLLIFALADIKINEILSGYKQIINGFKNQTYLEPLQYALIRYYLLTKKNKDVEVFATFDNNLRFISEHYKQIFAETEGKTPKCIIPTIANYSDDLHSIGQLYQQGNKNFFETFLILKENPISNLSIPRSSFCNDDELDYLINLTIDDFEKKLFTSVLKAHYEQANINCLLIKIDAINESNFGQIIAFLNLSACCSGLLLNINPFDQPGVEFYKNHLKKLLTQN